MNMNINSELKKLVVLKNALKAFLECLNGYVNSNHHTAEEKEENIKIKQTIQDAIRTITRVQHMKAAKIEIRPTTILFVKESCREAKAMLDVFTLVL